MNKHRNDRDNNRKVSPRGRRPYVKPAVISSEAFETMALSCGQQPGPCGFPGNS